MVDLLQASNHESAAAASAAYRNQRKDLAGLAASLKEQTHLAADVKSERLMNKHSSSSSLRPALFNFDNSGDLSGEDDDMFGGAFAGSGRSQAGSVAGSPPRKQSRRSFVPHEREEEEREDVQSSCSPQSLRSRMSSRSQSLFDDKLENDKSNPAPETEQPKAQRGRGGRGTKAAKGRGKRGQNQRGHDEAGDGNEPINANLEKLTQELTSRKDEFSPEAGQTADGRSSSGTH